jgi:hypothetical protein
MKLIFEKEGKQIEVEQTTNNHMLQVADYVKNGYTYIGTDAPKAEVLEDCPTNAKAEEIPKVEAIPKVEKVVQKRVLFTKGNSVKSVGLGIASYLNVYIIALTFTYILAILPRSVVKGAIGDILGLAVFIITIYTVIKVIQNRQVKLVIINYLIIGLFLAAGLIFGGIISVFVPFDDFTNMILNFIIYVIQVTVIYDMANHVNLACMKEYLKDGYEISNVNELTDDELNQINDLNYVKPFWQIVS